MISRNLSIPKNKVGRFDMENQNTNYSPVEMASAMSAEEKNNLEIAKAKADRKVIIDGIQKGTLCCLPGKDGYADTIPAKNPVTGTVYRGSTMLLLKQFAKENNFSSNEFITFESIDFMNKKLNLFGDDRIMLEKGSKGVSISYSKPSDEVNPETGKHELVSEHARLFNVSQLKNAEKVHEFEVISKHEKQEYIKAKLKEEGKNFYPKTAENNAGEIECSSTVPAEYLGQYLAAVSSGAKFKATPEQAASFGKKTVEFLYQKNSDGHINPFNLNILSRNANAYCKDFLKQRSAGIEEKNASVNPPASKPKAPSVAHNDDYEMGMGL